MITTMLEAVSSSWRMAAAMLPVCSILASAAVGADAVLLAPDQRTLIEKIAKPNGSEAVQYARASDSPVGAEITLPFGDRSLTLVRIGSVAREDGSISWHGQVKETGERAVLMLWGNALLTGYLGYNGTIYAIEGLGGGVHAFAELGRNKQLPDHPAPAAARDSSAAADPQGKAK